MSKQSVTFESSWAPNLLCGICVALPVHVVVIEVEADSVVFAVVKELL
jgi:hypothetical protein